MADRVDTSVAVAALLQDSQRRKEADFVLDFVEKSVAYRSPFVDIWKEVLDNYLVSPLGHGPRAFPRLGSRSFATARALTSSEPRYESVLKDSETNQIVETLAAQGIGLLMPQMDYIQTIPIGFDDTMKARYLGRLLQGVLQAPGNFRTHYTCFKDGFIFGTAILQIGWETRSRLQMVRKPVFDEATGLLAGFESDVGEVVYRDAPLIQQKDIFDFYPDPSGTRIQQDMLGVAHKFRISTQDAIRLADAGVYSMSGVREAIDNQARDEKGKRRIDSEERRFQDLETETHEAYGMLTGFEFWGEFPYKHPDGARNRVITILNGVHVRSHINPYLDGNIPFKEVVLNPIAGRFYGLGIGEVIRFFQDSADQLLMLFNDASDLSVRNVLLVGAGFNGDIGRLARRIPNDVIPVGNPDAVKPLPIDAGALQFASQELLRRKLNMREASGATNPLQSIPTSDRQTATEVTELVRLASQKVELMVQLIERDDYPWIGKTIHSRMRQFLSADRQSILAGEQFPVTLDDVDFEADIRFLGARQAQSKFQKAAALREAVNVLGTNPGIIPVLRGLIVRYFRDGLDIEDAEQIVDEAIGVIQQQQMMMQQPQMMGTSAQNANPSSNTTADELRSEGVAFA